MYTTEYLQRLLLLVFCSSVAHAATRHTVKWTPEGVHVINRAVTVSAGDSVTFMCPQGSFSTVWFMSEESQYDNCDCATGGGNCILVSNCQYFHPNNYTTDIKRISENLKDTPDYRPGNTYYFASFSRNLSTLANSSAVRSGGECLVPAILKLELVVLPNEDLTTSDPSAATTTTPKPGHTVNNHSTDDDNSASPISTTPRPPGSEVPTLGTQSLGVSSGSIHLSSLLTISLLSLLLHLLWSHV